MKKVLVMMFSAALVAVALSASAQDGVKSKFYDFSDQVIDGEIKKPTALYTEANSTAC